MTSVGELVRSRRTRLGLSQRAAARACGIPQSMLSRLESGETQPSVATLQRIVGGLGTQLHLELRTPDSQEPRREKERSLWLNRIVVGELLRDPDRAIAIARENIDRWRDVHAERAPILVALDRWSEVLDEGPDAIIDALTGRSEDAEDLRQNSPFAGVLTPQQREQGLASFRTYWEARHPAPATVASADRGTR